MNSGVLQGLLVLSFVVVGALLGMMTGTTSFAPVWVCGCCDFLFGGMGESGLDDHPDW